MIKNSYKINTIYFLLYISLLAGFFFNEDVTLGQIKDYLIHQEKSEIFKKNIINGFLKYEEYPNITHSPIYILYKIILEGIFEDKTVSRLFNLHLALFIPLFFYKSLKIKYQSRIQDYKIFIPAIFFFSPFYRAGSIWLDDNIVALIFFTLSIFFFTKFKYQEKKLIFVILNAAFLATAAYIRPIYSLFSIYFFFIFIYELKFSKKLFYYILLNIALASPAIYYVFILKITGWFANNLFLSNPITILSLVLSILFFYLLPILFFGFNKKNYIIMFFSTLFFLFQKIYFSYDLPYSGGTVFRFASFLFDYKDFFFIISSISFYFIYSIFLILHKNRSFFYDMTLLIILILLEIDGIIYTETYDPLIYLIFFLLFDNRIFSNYLINFHKKKFLILFIFAIFNYLLFFFKSNFI
jgi:hypothetical protein